MCCAKERSANIMIDSTQQRFFWENNLGFSSVICRFADLPICCPRRTTHARRKVHDSSLVRKPSNGLKRHWISNSHGKPSNGGKPHCCCHTSRFDCLHSHNWLPFTIVSRTFSNETLTLPVSCEQTSMRRPVWVTNSQPRSPNARKLPFLDQSGSGCPTLQQVAKFPSGVVTLVARQLPVESIPQ